MIVATGMPVIPFRPKTKAGYPVFTQILGFFPAQPLDRAVYENSSIFYMDGEII